MPSTGAASPRAAFGTTAPSSAAPQPAASTKTPTGTVSGYIYVIPTGPSSTKALVNWTTQGGNCNSTQCPNDQFTSTGGPRSTAGWFTLTVPAGPDTITGSIPNYLPNSTSLYVNTSESYYVGIIWLHIEGQISGRIYGSDSNHELVTTCTIGYTIAARSGTFTGSSGSTHTGVFSAYAPPVPSIVTFSPKAPCPYYNPSEIWVNVTVGGLLTGLVVDLPVNTEAYLEVEDVVTHKVDSPAAFQGCSTFQTSNCGPQSAMSAGPEIYEYIPAGYDTITVWGIAANGEGALVNTTNYGFVPALGPGHKYNLGVFYTVEQGEFALASNITYEKQIKANHVPWPNGTYVVATISSLDGFNAFSAITPNGRNFTTAPSAAGGCFNVGTKGLYGFFAAPLRSTVTILPDTGGSCIPNTPTWPIPTSLPIEGNGTMVNVSSNNKLVFNAGWVNMTAGTYVEFGVVKSAGTSPPSGNPTVAPTSATFKFTDQQSPPGTEFDFFNTQPTENPPPVFRPGWDPAGCTVSFYLFCLAVPFGPLEIQVTSTASGVTNMTWIDIPPGGYVNDAPNVIQNYDTEPLVTVNSAGAIVTSGSPRWGALQFSYAQIQGTVLDAACLQPGGGACVAPLGVVDVTVGPAGTAPSEFTTAVTIDSSVTGQWGPIPAVPGWDIITFSAPLYLSNSEWVYVTASSTKTVTAPTIYLTELGFIQGTVLTDTGIGILQASIQVCPIASQYTGFSTSCQPLGTTGTTNTAGQYYGGLPARPLPRGAYQIVATAAGYTSNWTWVNNTSPKGLDTASTLVLYSQSSTGKAVPRLSAGAPAAAQLAEWVVGNAVDNNTGLPVQGLGMQWQPSGGLGTSVPNTDLNPLDDYNTSIPTGVVYLNFSAKGYFPTSIVINVTGLDVNGTMFVPTVYMQPDQWFSGRVILGPGGWTSLSYSGGIGPGQQTSLTICSQRLVCGTPATVDLGGFFNLTGPTFANQYDLVRVAPYVTGTGTTSGGYSENLTTAVNPNTVGGTTYVTVPIQVNIFGVIWVSGTDASTGNLLPVRWPTATMTNSSGGTGTMLVTANGFAFGILGATFAKNLVVVTMSASAFIPAKSAGVTVGYGAWGSGIVPLGAVAAGNISLDHYGWISGYVTSSTSSSTKVPWAIAGYQSGLIGKPPTTYSTPGLANGAAWLNMTAPPGGNGTLTVSAPDYNATISNSIVSVNQSETTTLLEALRLSSGGIKAWGWITGSVLDKVNQYAVDQASVGITSSYGVAGASGVVTNGSGQFMIDAPPSPSDNVTINVVDYNSNSTLQSIGFGAFVSTPPINVTGDGILAGIVISYPGGQPIPFANVSLCPQAVPICSQTAQANGSGYFWIAGAPGIDNLTVSFTDYVTTSILENVTSDTWKWVGQVQLDEYAFLEGSVLGLPSGIPVGGANVSLCSTVLIVSFLVCPFVTLSTATGGFFIAVPAGNYLLQVNATLYNATVLPVQLKPGQTVNLGYVEIELYGFGYGYVLGADTNAPVNNTTIQACELWGGHVCLKSPNVDPTGRYQIDGPPGPYQIIASAGNYHTEGLTFVLQSGNFSKMPTIYLQPVGPGNTFTVSGTVYKASGTPLGSVETPLGGVVVNTGAGSAATTNAVGQFALSSLYGSYTLSVHTPGLQTKLVPLVVHQNISGLHIVLYPQTYLWTGVVADGFNQQPFNGVKLMDGAEVLGTTGFNGGYTLNLTNGTYRVTTVLDATLYGVSYSPAVFTISVIGSGGQRNVAIYPPVVAVQATVTSSLTSSPVPGASIVLAGTVRPESVGAIANGSTTPLGTATISVYTGVYNATVSAPGYLTVQVPVTAAAGNSSVALTVQLHPILTAPSASGSALSPIGGLAIGAGVVVVGAGAFLITRRLRAVPVSGGPSGGAGL